MHTFLRCWIALSPPPADVTRVAAQPVAAASAIKLDGDSPKRSGGRRRSITGFRQRDPKDGAAATFETEVRVAYDAAAIYVAVAAHRPGADRIVGMRTRRDGDSPSDWMRVMIDSFHDRRTRVRVRGQPGRRQGGRATGPTTATTISGWDAVWDVAVARNERGWRAEFRIPFSQLRFHPSADATFGFAVVRQIGRLNETSTWPLLSKSANGFVSSFGELTGLQARQRAEAARARARMSSAS